MAPGRVFPVTVEYRPPDVDTGRFADSLRDFIIPTLLETLNTYEEGNALVFLYGKQEIELAMAEFQRQV